MIICRQPTTEHTKYEKEIIRGQGEYASLAALMKGASDDDRTPEVLETSSDDDSKSTSSDSTSSETKGSDDTSSEKTDGEAKLATNDSSLSMAMMNVGATLYNEGLAKGKDDAQDAKDEEEDLLSGIEILAAQDDDKEDLLPSTARAAFRDPAPLYSDGVDRNIKQMSSLLDLLPPVSSLDTLPESPFFDPLKGGSGSMWGSNKIDNDAFDGKLDSRADTTEITSSPAVSSLYQRCSTEGQSRLKMFNRLGSGDGSFDFASTASASIEDQLAEFRSFGASW